MKQEDEIVCLKVFDKNKEDVVFEGKVSTDIEPCELVYLRCFRDRYFVAVYIKATNEEVKSFKGLQSNVELIAGRRGRYDDFSGVLYVGADDGVLRKSDSVPSCECVMMTVWWLSHEEFERAFKCDTLEELEINCCELRQVPREIGNMKKLRKLTLYGLDELKCLPEEIGELSNLEELRISRCGIGNLPKRLQELKVFKSIGLVNLPNLQLNAEDLVVFSKLKHLTIKFCCKVLAPPSARVFREMIKSTTDIRVLEMNWDELDRKKDIAALEENGSLVDGGEDSESFSQYFTRNKANHERALQCVVHLLAIRRCRNVLNGVPREMMRMLAMMLWNTKCDVWHGESVMRK